MNKDLLIERAKLCAAWMLRNQITDRQDANRGRGLRSYDAATGHIVLTGNWQTGSLCMCLLAMFKRTGNEEYLRAAEFAGRYIVSLQVMDRHDERYFGTIRELTPQSMEFAPRDATTAAWALAWLHQQTKSELYLERATLFAQWHMRHGMHEGWPLYACYMDRRLGDFYAQGSFQSGTGLFYHDLFMASGDASLIQNGLKPIAVNYRDKFFNAQGAIILSRDPFTGKPLPEPGKTGMHSYNDDFGAAMLQTAADFFADESFREKALAYARWLAREQREDGGFGEPFPSGVPVALMYFHDLGLHYQDAALLAARDRALAKLLSMQILDSDDPRLDGAFRGQYEGPKEKRRPDSVCVNMRCSGYALMALLKLESDTGDIWLGRHNQRFVDPLTRGMHELIW